jgi:small-conductance mechanosensitive channel
MEATMPDQSSVHAYLNWTKQRIDEMDATLASLESRASQVKAESKAKANQTIADLKKRRDEFQAQAKAQAQAGGAALKTSQAQLESQWKAFEAQVKSYFDTVGKQIEQQQTTFRDVAAAQAKAWCAAADAFHSEAGKIAAARRADLDAAVKQMKADAAEAEARFNKLKQAGSESWASLSAALAESRKAFDRANQKAGDALTSAGAEKAAS